MLEIKIQVEQLGDRMQMKLLVDGHGSQSEAIHVDKIIGAIRQMQEAIPGSQKVSDVSKTLIIERDRPNSA